MLCTYCFLLHIATVYGVVHIRILPFILSSGLTYNIICENDPSQHISQKGSPRVQTKGHMSMTKSGLASAIVFFVLNCLGLFSYIELCIFLCHLVVFVSTSAK